MHGADQTADKKPLTWVEARKNVVENKPNPVKGELRGKNGCISGVGPFHSDSIFDIMFCWRRISSSKNYQDERPK